MIDLNSKYILIGLVLVFSINSCINNNNPLPILGEKEIIGSDTTYHTIAPFKFYNQDSIEIGLKDFENKIIVADFFFTSCPTICPVMKKNMLKVQEAYAADEEILMISHTIDPKHDNVERLADYGKKLGIDSKKWYLLTGEKRKIYEAAENYMVAAMEDENAPGGFMHSGALVLIDKKLRIRGYYDGTIENEVNALIKDIKKLKLE